ncbi:ABC transporter substrate-binding protein [Dactylosporangium sp. CA-233914]|uniref:ABC transporter substrate-binding protein n=1 Tax=Dactylosporangium sp. CA-233914 TaxID=3239934 RepID=UPI003D8B237F
MNRTTTRWTAVIAGLALVLGTAGCSDTAQDGGAVTLKWQTYSQERLEFYKQAAAEFRKEFPNVTVVPETLTEDDYKQALPLSFRSKTSADIFVYTFPTAGDYFELSDVLANGWAQPLDSTVLPADFRSRFRDTSNLMEPIYGNNGKIYTVPRPPSTGAIGYGYMYFNKDVIAKAGLAQSIPQTWDEFTAACQAIRDKAGASCFAQPMQGPDEIDRLLIPFMSVNMKGYSPGRPSLSSGLFTQTTDPQFVAGIRYLRSLYEAKFAFPGRYDKTAARQAVANGQAAFYFDGGWMSSVFLGTFKFTNFGVALPPAKSASAPGGYLGRIGQGPPLPETFISAQSKHPKEATQFLEWMTRPDGWYTQHFHENGFDILPWADPAKVANWLPADNPTRDLLPLDPKVHVLAPQPALKCPDLAKSEALTKVDSIQENWVASTIGQYLTNGGDWVGMAKPIEDKQNQVFQDALKAETGKGLKVSASCFAEPSWDGLTAFAYAAK